jgi:hypothetical protein
VDKANVLETFQLWKDVVTGCCSSIHRRARPPHMYRQRRDATGQGAEKL